jgi:DNA repair exonuclease SbcCD ATPase subunit
VIRRIILENYMAHQRTVIEPAAGLTVLVGPNNCGKSAVVHALQTLCYNKPADFAVRHGEKEASVTVETDDGHVIIWRRKKGVVSYLIDGREVGRLGQGGVPDDLHQILRMPRIDPSNETASPFYVHFGLQKAPIFLLDDPPGRAATFFASSSDAEKLLEMQKRHREKARDRRRDFDRLTTEASVLDRRLETTAPVVELARRVTELEERHRQLTDAARALASRRDFLARFQREISHRATQAARVQAAETLAAPPHFFETAPLVDAIARLRRMTGRVGRDRGLAAAASPLQPPPELRDAGALQAIISRLQSWARQARRAESMRQAVAKLAPPPTIDLQRSASLASLIAHGGQCAARKAAAENELRAAERAIDAVRGQVQAWVEENPHCPLCGSLTQTESILAGEHEHV